MTVSQGHYFHSEQKNRLKVGLVINPFAGIGGEAGLKGSDGADIREKALLFNEKRRVDQRISYFLKALEGYHQHIDWIVADALMGHQHLQQLDIHAKKVIGDYAYQTEAEDTINAVQLLLAEGIDLLIFVGGDGTARNIVDAMSTHVALPCLGLPSGVKMQSAVFALSPHAAAEVVKSLISRELTAVDWQDVRDIDEQALREGRLSSAYYGQLLVPSEPRYMQNLKQGGMEVEEWVLDDIADYLTHIMEEESPLLLVGPGSTTAHWMASLGLENTLVGFDAVQAGELLHSDLTSHDILRLLSDEAFSHPVRVILSPTGQQGFLLGRGNQQLSGDVLQQLDKDNLLVISSKEKLKMLQQRPLLMDCNDAKLGQKFCGLIPIITAFNDQVLYPVQDSY